MFKAIILLKKKSEVSSEEFKSWWINSHSPKASQLPKIRKLCFNLVINDGERLMMVLLSNGLTAKKILKMLMRVI